MARFLADEDFSYPVVIVLREMGHLVLRVQELGLANIGFPDEGVLEIAISSERIVLTYNRKHFRALHRDNANHHGIVICTQDRDARGQAERIDTAVRVNLPVAGKLIRVVRPNLPTV